MVIAVDFDGTITERNCFPDIAPIREYALEAIHNLQAAGHIIVLWTCREGPELDKARHFLNEHGIELNGYNYSPYHIQSRKIVADIYIDDKNVFMVDDVDWHKIEEYIFNLNDRMTVIKKFNLTLNSQQIHISKIFVFHTSFPAVQGLLIYLYE